jgi:hypothetical protein
MTQKPEITVRYSSFGHGNKNPHIYATFFYTTNGNFKSEALTYKLNALEAEKMNKIDKYDSYQENDETRRFLTIKKIRLRAKEKAEEMFPEGFILKFFESV